jgi:predicted nucleotidyltransferase
MPLKKEEKETIIRIAREYGVKRVWLFGSAMSDDEFNDIDLGVEGLPPGLYFNFCGKLDGEFEKMVDVVVMDGGNPLRHIIRDRGKVIYERSGRKVPERTQKTHKKYARASART